MQSPGQILQVLAHGLFIGQVMIMLHQTVEQWLVGGSPHLLNSMGWIWLSAPVMGVVSISMGAGGSRVASGLREI